MTSYLRWILLIGILTSILVAGPACKRKDAPRFPTPRLTFNLTRIPSPTPAPSVTQGKWVQVVQVEGSVPVIVMSPSFGSDGTVFAGAPTGVLRSTDSGGTWVVTNNGITEPDTRSIVISPAYSQDRTVFAGTTGGVFKSTDGGESWTPANKGLTNKDVVDLLISPEFVNDSTIFAGTPKGLYKSTDGGDTWTEVNADFNVQAMVISPAYGSDNTIYLGDIKEGVNRSRDGGTTWEAVNSTGGSGRAVAELRDKSIRSLAISPDFSNDNTLYVGTRMGVARSLEGGDFWTYMNAGMDENLHNALSIAISSDFIIDSTMFVGTQNLVYGSTAKGIDWHLTGEGLPGTELIALAVSPAYATDMIILAGTTDGIFRREQ